METVVHQFRTGDTEDIYITLAINKWLDTEQGKWVKEHSTKAICYTLKEELDYCFTCSIIAELDGPDKLFFQLKWN